MKNLLRYRMIIIFALLSAWIIITPLQHHFSLSRYQHYGLCVTCLGTGYLTQVIWSWKRFTHWARVSYLSTAGFFLFVGITFYANPWLDSRVAMRTELQELLRTGMVLLYLAMSLALASIWIKWIKTENNKGENPKDESGQK